jgi:hypothetical protein
MMANVKNPTERSRHVYIQHFALQEWVQKKSGVGTRARNIEPIQHPHEGVGWGGSSTILTARMSRG